MVTSGDGAEADEARDRDPAFFLPPEPPASPLPDPDGGAAPTAESVASARPPAGLDADLLLFELPFALRLVFWSALAIRTPPFRCARSPPGLSMGLAVVFR
jgi:hypothetical protein